MIPIAKGKFSKPRQNRAQDEMIPEYIPPIQEPVTGPEYDPSLEETMLLTSTFQPAAEPEHDPSLDETMLLTSTFQPIRSTEPAPAVPPVPQETVTFEEAQFIQQTTVYNTEAPAVDPQLVEEDYDQDREQRRRKKALARKRARNRKILLVSICAVTLLLVAAIILGVMMYINANKDDGLILNNVTVAGVNIGGMTPDEAAAAIHRATDMTFSVENMVIHLPDVILELSPKDTRAKLDVNAAVEAAYNYGRTGTPEENKKAKADSLISNHTIALLPYLTLDTDYIRGVLEEYGNGFNSIFEESSWTLDGNMPELSGDKFDASAAPQTLILKPGKPGRNVDIDDIYNDVLDAYSMNKFKVVTEMTDKEQIPETLDLEEIFQMIHTEAVDASMDMETFQVTTEVYGYTFDLEQAKNLLSQTPYGETLEVSLSYITPQVLSADLEEKLFRDVLATTETPHTNDSNRNTNLKLACEAINGYVLMPGDTFDYNKVLGKRTEENGYKPAGALSAGTSTTEIGGGICQVSSTLYYAALLSDLEIVTRRSHSLPSTYMPMMGIDATVSWGGPEFRFRNNTNYPVRIEAEVSGGYVKIRLIGTDERDYYIKMEAKTVEVLTPKTVEERYTPEEAKAKGYRDGQVLQQPVTGYTVYSYKCRYDKQTDELISRDYEATSNYVKKDKIVVVIIADETEPEPTETEPEPTETEPEPTETEPKPTETEPKPTETEPEPTETEPKPTETEPKPTETEPEPTETEPKPTETEPKPTETEPKPTETEPKPVQTEPAATEPEVDGISETET